MKTTLVQRPLITVDGSRGEFAGSRERVYKRPLMAYSADRRSA